MATSSRPNRLRSQKHALVDRANAVMLTTIAVTSVVVVFSFFIGKALVSQYSYQNRVIKQKKDTLKQVKVNKTNAEQLVNSYKTFASDSINVLGGDPAGQGPRDGDNPRIVLDALPSKYDFPGLISSLEKLLTGGGFKIETIGGQEQPESATGEAITPNPVPIEMPFPLSVSGNYASIQQLLATLEASIRPIHITRISLQGSDADLRVEADAKTFYQPAKTFEPIKEVVK